MNYDQIQRAEHLRKSLEGYKNVNFEEDVELRMHPKMIDHLDKEELSNKIKPLAVALYKEMIARKIENILSELHKLGVETPKESKIDRDKRIYDIQTIKYDDTGRYSAWKNGSPFIREDVVKGVGDTEEEAIEDYLSKL